MYKGTAKYIGWIHKVRRLFVQEGRGLKIRKTQVKVVRQQTRWENGESKCKTQSRNTKETLKHTITRLCSNFLPFLLSFLSFFFSFLPLLLTYQLFSLWLSSFFPFFLPSYLLSSDHSCLLSPILPSPFFLASFPTFFYPFFSPPFQLNDPCRTRAAESDRARLSLIRTNQSGR